MNVMVMEDETFKRLEFLIERTAQLAETIANKDPDRIFSIDQAAEYLGVDRRWVDTRKKVFGYFKEGRIIRIRKSNIDKYLDKYTIKTK